MFPGESGGRARNTWATCHGGGENRWKRRLIPNAAPVGIDGAPKGAKAPPPRGARAPSARWRGSGPPRLTVSWSERMASRTGTEILPRLLREAAVEDHLQWAKA